MSARRTRSSADSLPATPEGKPKRSARALAALSAAAGETAVFLEATAFYALAIASVYGVSTEDRERRRALVLSVLVGDDSKQAMSELIGGGGTPGGGGLGGGGPPPPSGPSHF